MKRILVISWVLILSVAAFAQADRTFRRLSPDEVRATLHADPYKYGGIYYVDDFSDRDYTPAPKGYKPFYISSYARHGARYILSESQYTRIHETLTRARKEGNLTPFGEEVCARFEGIYPQLKDRAGDLTPLGKKQHKELGKRMIANYPEVFKGAARVHAFSTDVPRTVLSMSAFLEGLREANTKLEIKSDVSLADKHFLNPQSRDHRYVNEWYWTEVREDRAQWRKEVFNPMRERSIDCQSILGRLFKDVGKALGKIEPVKLTYDFFFLAMNMTSLPVEGTFMDLFEEKDLFALWECDNFEYYVEKGPAPYSMGFSRALGGYMMDDILTRAEKDIASGEVRADLRFGHDGCMMSLLTLMNVGTWNEVVPTEEVKEVWQVHNVPMAANLQFIFYRNKAGDILVKPLYDEKNLVLPFEPFEGPYYRWSDFLAYYRPVTEEAKALLAENIPYNILGRVTTPDGCPLEGVGVSDGIQIVKTASDGTYRMYSWKKRGTVFVITPSGYEPGTVDGIQPAFHARLAKPPYEREEHDFVLHPVDQDRYSMVFLTDVHLSNDPTRGDLQVFREITMPFLKAKIDSLRREGPVYSANLGDFTHELFWGKCNYGLADGYRTFLDEGYPAMMYSIPGNHDNDPAVIGPDTDFRAEHIFREVMGPTYYSMNIGRQHWIMMDNIVYVNTPGEGKKAPGVLGARNYLHGFNEDEWTFLRNDLALVPDGTEVILCTHCPVVRDGKKGTYNDNPDETAELDRLFARFGKVRIFSGHVHKICFSENDLFPHLTQAMLPALSGNMWTTRTNPVLCGDGEPAGVFVGRFAPDSSSLEFRSQMYGDVAMRIYDMNAVRSFYLADTLIRKELDSYGLHIDYSAKEYANQVYVNYWRYVPGETVEILENGKPLAVERTQDEDPLFSVSFSPVWDGVPDAKIFVSHKSWPSNHMFKAQAKTRKGKILVRVRDASGAVIREETLSRPGTFSREMR